METNPELKIKYRKIPSLKFLYEISKDGKIRNVKSKKFLKQRVNAKGYVEVSVKAFNVRPIHRLVAEAWVKNTRHKDIPIEELVVNHKDFNKQNNSADNLEWVTQKENIAYDWENGNREHLRPILSERAKKIFTGRTVPQEQVERCREMGKSRQQYLKDNNIVVGGKCCIVICPNGESIDFQSIGKATAYIAEKEGVKKSTIFRNLYKRHYAHGYKLIFD